MNLAAKPRRRPASPESGTDLVFYARIIDRVKNFYGVSALVLLVLLSVTSIYETRSQAPAASVFFAVLLSVLVILALNLWYAFRSGRSEVTFRVRLKRGSRPLAGLDVRLHKNKKELRTRLTDEVGEVTFTETLNRSDELFVTAADSSGVHQKAALYSDGHIQLVKVIDLR